MKKTKMILIGGFLGAGKTSMMRRAAEILKSQGHKVGLITNDQATNLVDTAFLEDVGDAVCEVSGSCFCCNFGGLRDAIDEVTEKTDGDITMAESVGSCTDLSATIMQPLKDMFSDYVDLAPLTVMADPEKLMNLLDEKYFTAKYIMTKQLDEADIILINKTDLLSKKEIGQLVERTAKRWPQCKVLAVSVKENDGVQKWMDVVLTGKQAGSNLATVDYDAYADGEAAYGWLNATYTFAKRKQDFDFNRMAQELLERLAQAFDGENIAIGHVKFLLKTREKQWMGNLTGAKHTTILLKESKSSPDLLLTINARVELPPIPLQHMVLAIVEDTLKDCEITVSEIKCLIPGRPNPTYHYDHIVG